MLLAGAGAGAAAAAGRAGIGGGWDGRDADWGAAGAGFGVAITGFGAATAGFFAVAFFFGAARLAAGFLAAARLAGILRAALLRAAGFLRAAAFLVFFAPARAALARRVVLPAFLLVERFFPLVLVAMVLLRFSSVAAGGRRQRTRACKNHSLTGPSLPSRAASQMFFFVLRASISRKMTVLCSLISLHAGCHWRWLESWPNGAFGGVLWPPSQALFPQPYSDHALPCTEDFRLARRAARRHG